MQREAARSEGCVPSSDGRQELPSCIRSKISQAAKEVHGLTFSSSKQAKLHCSEPSAVNLFVSAGKPAETELQLSRLEVIKVATSLAEVLLEQ